MHTLDIVPLRSESPPQKRSRMARVLKGFQFYLHTHTFIRNRNEPYLPLPSQPQLVLIYRPQRDGRLSRPWCEVAEAEIRTATSRLQIRHSTTQPLVQVADTSFGKLMQHSLQHRTYRIWTARYKPVVEQEAGIGDSNHTQWRLAWYSRISQNLDVTDLQIATFKQPVPTH